MASVRVEEDYVTQVTSLGKFESPVIASIDLGGKRFVMTSDAVYELNPKRRWWEKLFR